MNQLFLHTYIIVFTYIILFTLNSGRASASAWMKIPGMHALLKLI